MKKSISLVLSAVMLLLSVMAAGAAFDPYAENGYNKVIYTQDFETETANDFTATGNGAIVSENGNNVYSLSRTDTTNRRAGAPELDVKGVKYLKAEMKIKLNKLPNKDGVVQIATYGNSNRRPIANFSKNGKIYLANVSGACEYSAEKWINFVFYIDYVKGLVTSYVDGKLLANRAPVSGLAEDGFGQIVGVLYNEASADMIMYFDDIKYSVPSGSVITTTTTTTRQPLFEDDFSGYTGINVGATLVNNSNFTSTYEYGVAKNIRNLANDPEYGGTRGLVLEFQSVSTADSANKLRIKNAINDAKDKKNIVMSFDFYPVDYRNSWIRLDTSTSNKNYISLETDGHIKMRDNTDTWYDTGLTYNLNKWNTLTIEAKKNDANTSFVLTISLNGNSFSKEGCTVYNTTDIASFGLSDRTKDTAVMYLDNIFFGYETTAATTSSYESYVIRQSEDSALISASYTADKAQTALPIVAAYTGAENKRMTGIAVCESLSAAADNSPVWFDAYINDGNAEHYKVFFFDSKATLTPLATAQEF